MGLILEYIVCYWQAFILGFVSCLLLIILFDKHDTEYRDTL
jgi:hypothetical protein